MRVAARPGHGACRALRVAAAALGVALPGAACDGGVAEPARPAAVASVDISPAGDVVLNPGDTLGLTVLPLDAQGRVVRGQPVRWRMADTAVAGVDAAGTVVGRARGETTVFADAGGRTAQLPVRVGVGYTAAEIAYFRDVAFGFEFGALSPILRRWRSDMAVAVGGGATAADRAYVDTLAAQLTALVGGAVRVVPDPNGNTPLLFVPADEFARRLPPGLPLLSGFFRVQVDASQHLFGAEVYIRDEVQGAVRRRLIREEITQALGLGRDSPRHPASTFFDGQHGEPDFAPIDRALVEMLYRPELRVGMTADEAAAVLRTLRRRGAPAPSR